MGMKLKSTVNKPRTIDAIVIEDSSQESPRAKTLVPQLTEPIPNGERFPDIGYVHTLMKDCPKRHKTNVQIFEAIAAMGKGLQPDDFITEYYDQRVLAVLKEPLEKCNDDRLGVHFHSLRWNKWTGKATFKSLSTQGHVTVPCDGIDINWYQATQAWYQVASAWLPGGDTMMC
uniref:Uncharacterized protein n=1 Tax=Oryza punctata TaxID=4537 RepID=A0A0E0KMV0_ORYPU